MTENNQNANQTSKRWNLLWSCFEAVIQTRVNEQLSLLETLKNDHPDLFPELDNLIAAHLTDTSVLDKNLIETALAPVFEPPKTIAGFEVLEPLGRGGLSDVYKAQKEEADFVRTVAIKFATSGRYSSLVLASFKNELNILLGLNHPNIERLYEGGVTQEGIPYLVVEYIDGQHIDEFCDTNKLNLRARIKMFLQVCGAVSAMHQSLIIHRDIKAGNIMVDGDGTCKLLDFGLAKLTEQQGGMDSLQVTYSGLMMTLAYASPEQIKGQNITTASDVYSLGMLLHYLLTGQLPYTIDPNDLVKTTQQINDLKPPLASQNINSDAVIFKAQKSLQTQLQGDLDAILDKAISKTPARRYDSAQQLADDLIRYLKNEPVKAKPDSLWYRSKKFIQRHTLGVMTTAAVVLSLLGLTLMLFNRSEALERALQSAEDEKQRVSQVTTFLIDVFKLSDPLQSQTEIIDVKSLLDYSTQQLQNQLKQQPETKAMLYQTLASVYANMSDMEAAEELLSRAKALHSKRSAAEVLLTVLIEAEVLQKKGELHQAMALISSFEQLYEGAKLPLTLVLKKALSQGQLMYQTGELDAATETLQNASQVITLQSQNNDEIKVKQLLADIDQLLGNVFWKKGNYDKVKHHYQKSFDSNANRLGFEHHATLKSRSALGVLAYSQGDFELAKNHFENVLRARLDQLGESHYLTADAYNRLGATEYELGYLSEAESYYQKALTGFTASGLGDSIKFTRVLNNLGLIKRQQRDYEAAEQLFQRALDIQYKQLGAGHADLAAMYNNLGLVADDQNNALAALSWFKKAYQVQFDNNGTNNVNIAFAMTNMGRMYLKLKQVDVAAFWITKALELRRSHLGTDHLLYAATLMAEAELLSVTKNNEKAAESAEISFKIRVGQLEATDWRVADSRHLWLSLMPISDSSTTQMCTDIETLEMRFGAEHPITTAAFKRHSAHTTLPCAE